MMKIIKLFLSILFTLYAISMSAVDNMYYFRCYYDKINLPQTAVYHISQDEQGYIWLATGHGAFRFDGNEMVRLSKLVANNKKFYGKSIDWIVPDHNGSLLLSNGYIYNTISGKIEKSKNRLELLVNPPLFDKQHNLWLSYPDKFLKVNTQTSDSTFISLKACKGLSCSSHYVWGITSGNKIVRLSVGEGKISNIMYNLSSFQINEVSALCAIDDYSLLIGTEKNGLWLYDVKWRKAKQLIKERNIRDIVCYANSTYWIASEYGIYIYQPDNESMTHLKKDGSNPFAIQDHSIYTFFEDREGGLWTSSLFRGLSYIPNLPCKFHSFKTSKQYPGLKGTIIRDICEDGEGNIWLSTEDYGINMYNVSEGTFVNFSKDNGLRTSDIRTLCVDGNELWCGSYDKGIDVFDIKQKKIIRSYVAEGDDKDNYIQAIIKTSEGNLLVATRKEIKRFDKVNNTFHTEFQEVNNCKQLFEDSKNNLWCVGTNEIYLIPKKGLIKSFKFQNQSIHSIMESSKHEIWIATSSGIASLDRVEGKFNNYQLSNQIEQTNFTYRIEEDGQGFFWISTAHGLVRFNPSTKTSYVFTSSEGLPENRFQLGSSYKDKNGILYFGSISGFTSFDPTLSLASPIIPPVALSQVTCIGSQGGRMNFTFPEKKIVTNYTENNLVFRFSSLTYTAPEVLQFRFRMEPVDKNWNLQQGFTPVNYAGLSPGKYRFHIQTTDYNGVWADNEVCYEIVVTPPFYLSWWAKCFYVLLGLLFVVGCMYRWHVLMKKKQTKHIQDVRNVTEKELYHTKINFFTTIVHEIRTPLTMIQAPLEKEMEDNQSNNLMLVKKNVERLHNLCTQLLDFRKMESEQLQLNYVQTNVPDLLKAILYRFSEQMVKNNIKCKDNLDEVTLEAPVDREAFTKIVSNLLTNAMKYGVGKIEIELGTQKQNFFLSVRNDGPLIKGSDRSKIFNMFYRTTNTKTKEGTGIGLSFCRALAEMHNGKLDLVDDDQMVHFRLTLPLVQDMVFSIENESSQNNVTAEEVICENADIPADLRKETLLVVEDEPDLRTFLQDSLSENYKVLVASNGVQAIKIMEKVWVSLVITDVMMPKMDGCELCREIKNKIEWSGIPVIMLTAKNTVEARLEGYMAGAEEYIEKPFSMKYLSARVDAILTKKAEEREKHKTETASVKWDFVNDRGDEVLVDKFQQLVKDNLKNSQLSIPFLCEQLGMSQTSFFRRMKQLLEVSPNDYIRIKRLEYAAQILREVDHIRISDVAYELNFSSPSYFTRCFVQHFGESPTEYVAKYKKEES